MSKARRQQILLAVVGVMLVIAIGRQMGVLLSAGGFGGQTGGVASSRTGANNGDWRLKLPQVEELQLDLLEEGTDALGEGRDPFQIRPSEPVRRPEPADLAASEARKKQARELKNPTTVAPVVPTRPTPPPVDVVYLGSFGRDRSRLAVFSDGKEIFNVSQGHVLKDKFVVMRIGFESADLGFVGFPDAPAQRLEIGG